MSSESQNEKSETQSEGDCVGGSSATACSPTDPESPHAAGRPHSPNVGAHRRNVEFVEKLEEVAAWRDGRLYAKLMSIAASLYESDREKAAVLTEAADRITKRPAVASGRIFVAGVGWVMRVDPPVQDDDTKTE